MPVTVDEVKQRILEGFPGANVDDVQEKNHRIVGTIVWRDFKGKDPGERSQLVTDRVLNKLGHRGLNVGWLLPLAREDEP